MFKNVIASILFSCLTFTAVAQEKTLIAETTQVFVYAIDESFTTSKTGLFLEVEMIVKEDKSLGQFLVGIQISDCQKDGGEIKEFVDGKWVALGVWNQTEKTGLDRIAKTMCFNYELEKIEHQSEFKNKGVAL